MLFGQSSRCSRAELTEKQFSIVEKKVYAALKPGKKNASAYD